MQVMYGGDATQSFEVFANGIWVHTRRHYVESHGERVAEQTPCSPNNHYVDNQARYGIDPAHPCQENQQTCNNDTGRNGCICRHVKKSASSTQITLAPGGKQ